MLTEQSSDRWSGSIGDDDDTPATGTPAAMRRTPHAPADRKYLLERVDDAAVVQLYADGFARAAAATRRC